MEFAVRSHPSNLPPAKHRRHPIPFRYVRRTDYRSSPGVFVSQPPPTPFHTPMHNLAATPLEFTPAEEARYELFADWIWHNSEVCNACFQQIRSIGPEVWKSIDSQTLYFNEWYDRTEKGSQEHTTWDHNKRFGTCFCLDCGTDASGNHRQKSIQELKPLAANILRYTKYQTPHDIDGKRFGREIRELKTKCHAQGYETEVLGLAFARALIRNTDADSSGSTHSVSAD